MIKKIITISTVVLLTADLFFSKELIYACLLIFLLIVYFLAYLASKNSQAYWVKLLFESHTPRTDMQYMTHKELYESSIVFLRWSFFLFILFISSMTIANRIQVKIGPPMIFWIFIFVIFFLFLISSLAAAILLLNGLLYGILVKKICNTKILVCSVGNENTLRQAFETDLAIYKKYYHDITSEILLSGQSLVELITKNKFNIVHIIGCVDQQGNIGGIHVNYFHKICKASNAKLVFWAFGNSKEMYSKYFKLKYFNLVFTLDRQGQRFVGFLDGLLSKMIAGKTIPRAWLELISNIEKAADREGAPACALSVSGEKTVFLP